MSNGKHTVTRYVIRWRSGSAVLCATHGTCCSLEAMTNAAANTPVAQAAVQQRIAHGCSIGMHQRIVALGLVAHTESHTLGEGDVRGSEDRMFDERDFALGVAQQAR